MAASVVSSELVESVDEEDRLWSGVVEYGSSVLASLSADVELQSSLDGVVVVVAAAEVSVTSRSAAFSSRRSVCRAIDVLQTLGNPEQSRNVNRTDELQENAAGIQWPLYPGPYFDQPMQSRR